MLKGVFIEPDPTPALSANIRLLCSSRSSISDVCRSIEINRQQFNKYLSGSSSPSSFNLQKIADFFGLEADELYLPHADFRRKCSVRGVEANNQSEPQPFSRELARFFQEFDLLTRAGADVLKRFEGFYFRYNYTFDSSGQVCRSLFHVKRRGGVFHTHLLERIQHRSNQVGRLTTLNYKGVMVAMSGCLFNVEIESMLKSCIGFAAFACVPRPEQHYVTGIQSSFSSASSRPAASRVVLERIARPGSIRDLIRTCGTFGASDPSLDPHVVSLIGNHVADPSDIFTLRDL